MLVLIAGVRAAVDRPGAGAECRQEQEPARHGEILLELDRLARGEVEDERRQETEAGERDRRPARLQAGENEKAAAELGQDHERQEHGRDAVLAHVVRDADVSRDLSEPFDDEDIRHHRAREKNDGTGEAAQERKVRVRSDGAVLASARR